MTDHDSLLAILNQQEKVLASQTVQLSNIEKSLVGIAVQEKDISYINMQIDALWKKYDAAFGPEGVLADIKAYQASCPTKALETSIKQLWGAIVLIVGLIGTIVSLIGAIKIWG